MPTSDWRQIATILEHVEDAAIADRLGLGLRVLDVGCGWGRYGVLVRDSWPSSYVVGIDAKPDDVRWRDAYDEILGATLPIPLDEGPPVGYFDVVLLVDVIEHLDVVDGESLLTWCRYRGPTVVATPNGFTEQRGDDTWERHRSGWDVAMLWSWEASSVQTVLPRERPPASMGPGQLVALFPEIAP